MQRNRVSGCGSVKNDNLLKKPGFWLRLGAIAPRQPGVKTPV
ncbi:MULTISPECIES: hypothetical protein [unclassified Desertifilum]|nr:MULTISPECIES: hypothetical protein [unclassified Desertifilum]